MKKEAKEVETMEVATDYKIDNGGISDEQIAAWKGRHGRIGAVEVDCDDTKERYVGYFRRPDMKTMEAFSSISKNNEIKAASLLFDNCWLGGASILRDDAIMKMEAIGAMQQMFGRCVSRLKNL